MAKLRNTKPNGETAKNEIMNDDRYAQLRNAGRITVRIVDAQSGLRILNGVYVVRMNDEGVRRLFMNDYTPTIGKVIGDVTFLTDGGEEEFKNIRGFYKMQHNLFTLLIEEHLSGEEKSE